MKSELLKKYVPSETHGPSIILTIDDDSVIRGSYCRFLEDFDFHVVQAQTGKEGLHVIDQITPDLVLLDLILPDMDGLEVLNYLYKNYPRLPVIVVSRSTHVLNVVKALRLGAWDFYLKPIEDLNLLVQSIQNTLKNSHIRKENSNYQLFLEEEVSRRTTALLEHEENLRITLESIGDGVISTNSEGRIVHVNRAAEKFIGVELDQLYGLNINTIFPLAEEKGGYIHLLPVKDVIRSGIVVESEKRLVLHSGAGNQYPIAYKLAPILSDEQQIVGLVLVFRDLTKEREAEQVLLRMNEELERRVQERSSDLIKAREHAEHADKMKSVFLANMSHEIRTPMNSILGFTKLLIDGETDNEKIEYLTTVHSAGQNLLELINDILDFSKIEAEKIELAPRVFVVSSFINQLKKIFSLRATQKGLKLSVEQHSLLPDQLYGDDHRLNQVLFNVIGNALKFTEKGSVEVLSSYEQGYLKVIVKDSGIGIPADKRDQVFMPFKQADNSTTRKYGGTGLGLAISRKIVELMGGEILLTSTEGAGSQFTISVPMTDAGSHILSDKRVQEDIVVSENEKWAYLAGKRVVFIGGELEGCRQFENILDSHHLIPVAIKVDADFINNLVDHRADIIILCGYHGDENKVKALIATDIRTALIPYFYLDITEDDYIFRDLAVNRLIKKIIDYFKDSQEQGRLELDQWMKSHDDLEGFKSCLIEAVFDLEPLVMQLQSSLLANDKDAMNSVSHALKGLSGNYGMNQLLTQVEIFTSKLNDPQQESDTLEDLFLAIKRRVVSLVNSIDEEDDKPGESFDLINESLDILVVDNQIPNLKLLQMFLRKHGLTATAAEGGEQALQYLRKSPFDIVFLDIQMPGLSGEEVLDLIIKDPSISKPYVVALTANAMKGDRERYLSLGFDSYLPKPVTDINLLDEITIASRQLFKSRRVRG